MISRRSFVRVAGTGAVALSFGGLLTACASREESAKNGRGESAAPGQVVIAMPATSEPSAGFDPAASWGCGEHQHEPLIQSTLITTDSSLEFVNDLATGYECSKDGLTWTFAVRDDVKFSDEKPLTAKDVAFTIETIRKAPNAEADLSMVKKARAVDDTTVEIELNKPFNALLYTLAVVGIVPEHAYGESYGENPIGSGRYMLEQWDKGQQVILKANPLYYGSKPTIERVVVVFMEEDASLAAVKAGEVDIAYTSATYANDVPNGYSLLNCATVDSRGISLPTIPAGAKRKDGDSTYNAGNDVTCDIAVRRAINYAVDRESLISNVLNGYGKVAYSVGDGMPWTSDDMKCERNVEEAKKMLDKAGWKTGEDGVRVKDGVRAELTLRYASSDSVRQAIAEEFANQMTELGIDVKPSGGSWDELYTCEFQDPIVWGWGSNSPTEVYYLNYSSGWGNFACYENKKIDAHLDRALAQPKVEDSYRYWKEAQWDGKNGIAPKGAATWVWLANVDHLYFSRDGLNVADQKPHPHGHGWSLVNNVDAWSWNN